VKGLVELVVIVHTGYGQNGDKPKRLQFQSKRINLLSSTTDLLVNFWLNFSCTAVFAVQSLVSKISWAQISFALTSGIARDGILYFFSYNIFVACHIADVYSLWSIICITRTVGVVWICRRFDYIYSVAVSVSPFWPVAVLTCRRFDHRPCRQAPLPQICLQFLLLIELT